MASVCFILYKVPKALEPHILILKYDKANMDNVLEVISKNSLNNKLISQTSNLGQGEIVYKLRPKDNENLLKEIRAVKGINEASLLIY